MNRGASLTVARFRIGLSGDIEVSDYEDLYLYNAHPTHSD